MNLLIILLGCNIMQILHDRLDSMFKFTRDMREHTDTNSIINITIFLSGGIKNNFPGAKSEASVMRSLIGTSINKKPLGHQDIFYQQIHQKIRKKMEWNFVLDEESVNTAENFVRASMFLNSSGSTYDDVYVVTSEYHKPRAKLMLDLIDSSREYKWILGPYKQIDSEYWESIHIRNVLDDIDKAKKSVRVF